MLDLFQHRDTEPRKLPFPHYTFQTVARSPFRPQTSRWGVNQIVGDRIPTVILGDDHSLFRESLQETLEARQWAAVVGVASDGKEAVHLADRLRPDVAVLEACLPELSGSEATARITNARSSRVLILSSHTGRRHVEMALQAGALGYITKHSPLADLHKAIAAVAAGKSFLSPDVARHVVHFLNGGSTSPTGKTKDLSTREREILQLLADGLSSKEIAARLSISVATVQSHRNSIMTKSGVHKVSGLVRLAIREGLVDA